MYKTTQSISLIFALALVTCWALPVSAAQPKAPSDAVVADQKAALKKHPGRKVYRSKTCLACHGKDGAKAILDYPNIAGQNKKYIIAQIEDILSGKRSAGLDQFGKPRTEGMRGALVTAEGDVRISKQEIEDVADYLSLLPPPAPKPPAEPISEDRIKAGEKLYNSKGCKSCHGKDGLKPSNKAYPYIAGQKSAYIALQITDIKEKVRKNSKSKMMVTFTKKLSDEDILLIADYLSQIDRSGK